MQQQNQTPTSGEEDGWTTVPSATCRWNSTQTQQMRQQGTPHAQTQHHHHQQQQTQMRSSAPAWNPQSTYNAQLQTQRQTGWNHSTPTQRENYSHTQNYTQQSRGWHQQEDDRRTPAGTGRSDSYRGDYGRVNERDRDRGNTNSSIGAYRGTPPSGSHTPQYANQTPGWSGHSQRGGTASGYQGNYSRPHGAQHAGGYNSSHSTPHHHNQQQGRGWNNNYNRPAQSPPLSESARKAISFFESQVAFAGPSDTIVTVATMEKCINQSCPWSGQAVSSAALTIYKGRTVGFCKAECRDKFASEISQQQQTNGIDSRGFAARPNQQDRGNHQQPHQIQHHYPPPTPLVQELVQEVMDAFQTNEKWPTEILAADAVPTLDACINQTCPWSGLPVVASGLTLFQGRTVGFCGEACKEKFLAGVASIQRQAERAAAEASNLAASASSPPAVVSPDAVTPLSPPPASQPPAGQLLFNPALEDGIRQTVGRMVADAAGGAASLAVGPPGTLPPSIARDLMRGLMCVPLVPYHTLREVKQGVDSYARCLMDYSDSQTTAHIAPNNHQRILILVAFPGAGKSFFSERLIEDAKQKHAAWSQATTNAQAEAAFRTENSSTSDHDIPASMGASSSSTVVPSGGGPSTPLHLPGRPRIWIRVNQDTLGNRRQCELACEKALKDGHSIIIDRTNIDIQQRRTWVVLARRYGVRHIESVHLKIPVEVCKQRVMTRANHETLPPTAASLGIVDRFLTNFVPPIREEGFTQMHTMEYSNEKDQAEQRMRNIIEKCNKDD